MLQFPRPRLRTHAHRIFQSFLTVGLAVLLFLAPLNSHVSAQQISASSKQPRVNQFTIYQDENGDTVCRTATLTERLEAGNVDTRKLGLRQINHLKSGRVNNAQSGENNSTGLTIILRATTQLQQNATAVAAFNRAAQNWENIIKSPITIYIDVDYGSTNFGQAWGAGVLGSTGTADGSFPYQSVRTNMIAEAVGEGNATKQAIFNALPSVAVPTNLGDSATTSVSDPVARAIGLLPATAQSTDSTSRIAFNSNFNFDFNPDDGITTGQTDFDAVATHELGHALGFSSEAGIGSSRPAIWDLYRFRTGTTSATFSTAQRIMTIGGSPDPLQYDFIPGNNEIGLSTGGPSGVSTNGGDGWQSSHWKHSSQCSTGSYIGIMDPAISTGCRRAITPNDSLALGSFGYNLTNNNAPPPPPAPPAPPANDNFANAQTISGCNSSVTGTTISATKETNEPSHNPSDSGSGSPGVTVWYQWTAPSSGSTTITTEGSDFDTMLAVYTGSSLGSLSRITFNDDANPGVITTSTVTFNATAGTTYKIAVDGYDGDSGTLKLNWAASNCTAKTDQTITFGALSNKTFGDAPFTVSATASSGLPVSFAVASGPASISGNTVTITGAGNVTIRASQAGNATYNAAPNVDQTFTVSKATPVITWNNPADITYGAALGSTQLNATASVPGTFIYTPLAGTVLNAGNGQALSVNFTPTDTANYNTASKSVAVNVLKAGQSITFAALTDKTFGDADFTISATASSALPVSFSAAGNCTVSGSTVHLTASGSCTITASQAGNANYNAASNVDRAFNIGKANQTISFGALPNKVFGDAPFTVSSTASSGLSVGFQVLSGPASISGNTVTITGAGNVTIRASQAGDANHNAAANVDQSFNVASSSSTITLANLVQTYDGTAKFATAITNPMGLSVNFIYSQNGSPVTSPINAGSYSVTATINDPNYQGTATGTLVINQATPVVTWNNPADITAGTALSGTQLNATANVPGAFQYTPQAGTVPALGNKQLSVIFTPTDTTNYNSASKTVQLMVVAAPQPTVSFSSPTYSAVESAGSVVITVNRSDSASAASVDYMTSDAAGLTACSQASTGIASSRCDYATTVGTLRFAAGENSKTISVPVVDDGYVESNESFTITLSNPGGLTLGANSTATVTITDNDNTPSNPIAGGAFFIRQQYIDFLGREPDPGGYAAWQNILNNCAAGDTSCDRISVSSGFFRSPEFQDRGYFVFRFYPALLGRNPSYAEFMPDLAKVSGFLSDAQLEANKAAFVQEFMTRTEFANRYGSLSNAAFVDALFQTAGLMSFPNTWVGQLNDGSMTRAQVVRAFTESAEVYNKFYNRAFVVMQYFGYLRRDPDALYLQWVDTMNQNDGDYRGMINGFMNSNEYVLRFGP